ncbi:MAG: ammonia-forming cytochrome c nitrite reductase subunit c552 [Cyclobacteriaceae bacterium]|nr:ammonia-forming cytochrome c nitrite reductase subunit c552 [Cyclobacteriaceae bacterium]
MPGSPIPTSFEISIPTITNYRYQLPLRTYAPNPGSAGIIITASYVFGLGLLTQRHNNAEALPSIRKKLIFVGAGNVIWGRFAKQYETYMSTRDASFVSKYNGNAHIDQLELFPDLVVLWAGSSKITTSPKVTYMASQTLYKSLRTGAPTGPNDGPMPATCWTCKSPDVPRLMNDKGVKEFYEGKWARHGEDVVNPIGCADCHNEKTMNLQISRPALKEAFERQGLDITQSTHQQMRTLVCAQCHVEYYFNTKKPFEGVPYLTFPWDNGTTAEDMENCLRCHRFQRLDALAQ